MELTPEERQRIYQEEKARIEAAAQVRREAQQKRTAQRTRGCLIAFGVVLLLGVLLIVFRGSKPQPTVAPVVAPETTPSLTANNPEAQPTEIEESPSNLRARLKVDYLRVVQAANPHLNFIEVRITGGKGRYKLWAVHEYFNKFSLSIGDDAKVISTWIDVCRSDLRRARIDGVGLRSSGSHASWCWLEVQ